MSNSNNHAGLEQRALSSPFFTRVFTRWIIQQQEFWLLGLACLTLLCIVAGRIQEHREISRSRQRVAQAVLAIQAVENVSTLLLSAETSQRGFLLTGTQSYLQPYEQVLHEMPAALSDFEAASKGLDGDPVAARTMARLAHSKFAEMSEAIRLYRRSKPEAALALVRTNAGQHLMEQAWQASKLLKQSYIHVFTQESNQLEQNNRRALRILAAGSVCVLAILIFSTIRLQRLFQKYRITLEALQEGQEGYRLLAHRLETVREEERAHLAREIHDELGQTLTTIKLGIATANRLTTSDPAGLAARLNEAVALTDQSIRSLRRIASELRPPLLDTVGLATALRAYTGELQERTGLQIQFVSDSTLPPLSPDQRITAYRICQESLTNVLRHSDATKASVSLFYAAGYLQLQVVDNGQGFIPQEAAGRRSLGLLGMEERAELVRGELLIASHPGEGAAITFRLPIAQTELAVGQ